jgi:hypothetical protein
MHHVREIDEIRHPVSSDPGDGFFSLPVPHQFFDFRIVLGNKQVAGPAISHCRNAGDRGLGSVAMTEQARDAVVTRMDFVTKSDRLNRGMVPKVQRQNIHEGQNSNEGSRCDDHAEDKPR